MCTGRKNNGTQGPETNTHFRENNDVFATEAESSDDIQFRMREKTDYVNRGLKSDA